MLQQKFNWSESSTGILSQMAESGKTATDVAITLGCTRSAVLGKAKRLGVSFSNGQNGRRPGSTAKPPSQWTEERITRAAELWKRGVSSGDIAEEIGSSQNALLALMDRRRDQFPHRRGRGVTQPKKPRIVPSSPIEKIERVNGTFKFDSVPFLLPEFPGVKFIDLEAQHCKFPVSNDAGPELLCCGAPRLDGHPYCGVHLSVSRGRGTRSEQMALDGRVWK